MGARRRHWGALPSWSTFIPAAALGVSSQFATAPVLLGRAAQSAVVTSAMTWPAMTAAFVLLVFMLVQGSADYRGLTRRERKQQV